jgi:CRISPR-associated endonuclease/helicase Cas3
MTKVVDAGPGALPKQPLRLEPGLVLRRRDLLDLFDTTPDLAGNDVDVSRFIREADENDVRVFWRDLADEPERSEPSPAREELCAAPVAVAREWLKKGTHPMWTWDGLRGRWVRVSNIHPGMSILLRSSDGGYDPVLGFNPKVGARVAPVVVEVRPPEQDREYDGDPESEWRRWYTLTQHSDDVAREAQALARATGLYESHAVALATAGRWHDAGKAHPIWQAAAKRLGDDPPSEPVAKSFAQRGRIEYEGRPGFRHELASALLALQNGQSDLVAYLVGCHHGKVRLSIRSLPTERAPRGADGLEDRSIRYARGIWEGDALPEIDLGDNVNVPATTLTLRYMELGEDAIMGASWLARALALRDDPTLGPFRLGFLEALIKCADERASRAASPEKRKP